MPTFYFYNLKWTSDEIVLTEISKALQHTWVFTSQSRNYIVVKIRFIILAKLYQRDFLECLIQDIHSRGVYIVYLYIVRVLLILMFLAREFRVHWLLMQFEIGIFNENQNLSPTIFVSIFCIRGWISRRGNDVGFNLDESGTCLRCFSISLIILKIFGIFLSEILLLEYSWIRKKLLERKYELQNFIDYKKLVFRKLRNNYFNFCHIMKYDNWHWFIFRQEF